MTDEPRERSDTDADVSGTIRNNDTPAYSDTTRAVLDLALDRLASQFPADVLVRLRGLIEDRKLANPEAVLAAVSGGKEAEGGGDQDPEDSSG